MDGEKNWPKMELAKLSVEHDLEKKILSVVNSASVIFVSSKRLSYAPYNLMTQK